MTYLVLMAGLFLLIYLKEPFNKKIYCYIWLSFYLMVLALYIINTAFVHLISNNLLFILAVIAVMPLIISCLKSSTEFY
ncbi:hypothetical protein P9D34_19290 [Bacillus swezeyi]|uniref:Uncharacterized protein n=1 Tax=Bacillus swezeyi TaxID=1925020 RepID=A0A1R1Q8S6_9BACI|nr:hypothetical protein [Bacillus swezeyi]MEC1262528.1 hypothetical protein [Bacillus swezeyi]MED2926763.1 hypothetical protein [Bacillus swezeyi]MED2965675.1 hypothetical protein [Bacillus swezeyi]MED2978366.1 hypothetical protein [Bacillus swezeyi]MED3070922.1 hypothetical protein [Bacillus swezeyi]